jgi:hypothetical protein
MAMPDRPLADEALSRARLAAREAASNPVAGEDPLDAALRAHTEALAATGMLAMPQATEWDAPEAARWLAEATEYPRYSHGLGWQLLLDSSGNVKQAVRKAREAHEDDPDPTFRARLSHAREILLRYAQDDGE